VPVPRAAAADTAVEDTERWFIDRGVPHFIRGYSASRDVFTRVLPILTAIFLLEMLGALNFTWAAWVNVLAAAGGFGLLLGVWVLANVMRDRPPLARPDQVGRIELVVFVLAPAALPLVFGGQLGSAALTVAGNLTLLGMIYIVTSYGLVPMTRWGVIYVARQLGSLLNLLIRALPFLLLFVTFLFIQTESWQVASQLPNARFVALSLLFVAVGVLFVIARLPREIGELAHFESWVTVRELATGTPAEQLAPAVDDTKAPDRTLTRRQWGNVSLVVLVATGVQVVFVSIMIGAFFVLFGMLAVPVSTVATWVGVDPADLDVIGTLTIAGDRYHLTVELLRVAGFLAAFSGLYFTVYVLTDATYRSEFFDEVVGEVRVALAARAIYLAASEENDER
jgi:hypothetical protein